jgi:hypothetical protein
MPQPGMPQQQMRPGPPQPPAGPAGNYVQAAFKLIPSVTEKNPYLKEQVGHLIYDYVQGIIGVDKAPKITGMLIELPVAQIKEYLTTYEALVIKVQEANNLLNQEGTQ